MIPCAYALDTENIEILPNKTKMKNCTSLALKERAIRHCSGFDDDDDDEKEVGHHDSK